MTDTQILMQFLRLSVRKAIVSLANAINMTETVVKDTMSVNSKVFDKIRFDRTLVVKAIQCEPKHCSKVLKEVKKHLLRKPGLKPVVRENGSCIVLLDSKFDYNDFSSLDAEDKTIFIEKECKVGYENFTADEVFRELIPLNELESEEHYPSSFETIGHIAHFNLRESFLPYKKIIGQVIIDKNPQIKTVVNKTSSISSKFRTFPMELLAGKDAFKVVVKEHGCKFTLDFREVYWNSKLQEEHKRLVDSILAENTDGIFPQKKLCVADAFCGIGPFAVPLAKAGNVEVHASDLNPKSYEYLVKSLPLNKLVDGIDIKCYNLDAKDFILDRIGKRHVMADHVIMNLPDSAIRFLKYFSGTFTRDKSVPEEDERLPMIHCYCFSKADDVEADVRERAENELGAKLNEIENKLVIRKVRDVAPKKLMMCIEFKLTPGIAFGSKGSTPKRQKKQ